MVRDGQPPTSDKPSIKCRYSPIDGPRLEFVEFSCEDYAPSSSANNKQNGERNESKSADILSKGDLISAVGQIWDQTSRILSCTQPTAHLSYDKMDLGKANLFCFPTVEENVGALTSSKGEYFSVNIVTSSHPSPMVKANLEYLKVTEKISFFEPCSGNHVKSLLWRFVHHGSSMPIESCRKKGLASVGISYDLENVYDWMGEIAVTKLKHRVISADIIKKKHGDCYTIRDRNDPAACPISSNASNPDNNMSLRNDECRTEGTETLDSSCHTEKSFMNEQASVTSLCTNYFLEPVQDIEEIDNASRTSISRLQADYYMNLMASHTSSYEESQHNVVENPMKERKVYPLREFPVEDTSKLNTCSSTQHTPGFALARQEHAFAGAFAGIFVSLCLHPVDTIKTVTQSSRTKQKSIDYIMKSIISQRGVPGLYRGVASNIASSAPISAVYTFTYESVKSALLPLFSEDYHSLAHCGAGGCASIATSFIFTPSERIKQQMQVRSHYQNCWNALTGIAKMGGLSSLYTGWGAVLCRNVPHSIIKFYTYESLKQTMLSSLQSNGQSSTLVTLVCGGLAGSTAALFTTPFDVVKTRLQTQIPGSISQYNGVFNTLKGIAQHEGLKGLYRGLTPRLVMYMTQGALFFASYESFKRLFSLEAPQLGARTIQCDASIEEDVTSL